MSKLNVMLDLETLGTRAGFGVLSIGACTFDRECNFYDKIDPASSRIYLKEDQDTLRWWHEQNPEARKGAFSGTKEMLHVLNDFSDWFGQLPATKKDIVIWGNGADFDLPILQAAYAALDLPIPWSPYSGRCYRTLKTLLPHVTPPERKGMHHHALADARFQAEHAVLLLNMI